MTQATAAAAPVMTPLHLVCKLKSRADSDALKQLIEASIDGMQEAMTTIGTVHFAHWFFLDEGMTVILATEYDGDFDRYIRDFISAIGQMFNALLPHLADPPNLPVEANADEFIEWVRAHDIPTTGKLIVAYPNLTVQKILALEKDAA